MATETTYDDHDRVTAVIRKGATAAEDLVTTNVYDDLGELSRIILPKGNIIEYGYDAVGRVASIERKPDTTTHGERVLYTLDSVGHRVRQEQQSWTGSAWQTEAVTDFIYSSRCSLDQIVLSDGSVREFAYDCNGNLEKEWDGNHPSGGQKNPASRVFGYDVLDRRVTVNEPWGGVSGGSLVTRFAYDVQDHRVRVTDPNGTVTRITYSDRDLRTEVVSEVAGISTFSYNDHKQLIRQTDGRGISLDWTFDELDRVIFVDYPGSEPDTAYTYDDPAVPFSKGRPTAITRGGHSVEYRYDGFGRVTRNGSLTYGYDRNGNRATIGYPGGVTASYGYDFTDRASSLSIQSGAAAPRVVVSSAEYLPTGPLTRLSLGNGLTEEHLFDNRYLPTRVRVPGLLDWIYSTDAVGNVTTIVDNLDPQRNRAYNYQDQQYFLIRGDGPWGKRSWTYDFLGNRLTEDHEGVVTVFDYEPNAAGRNSAKLAAAATGSRSTTFAFDSAGQLCRESSGEAKTSHHYDGAGRLIRMRRDASGQAATTDFVYDGRDFLRESNATRLTGEVASNWSTRSTYSSDGVLHHRSTERRSTPQSARGATVLEEGEDYVFYFAGRPVAQLTLRTKAFADGRTDTENTLIFLTTDHIGTPILATDGSGAELWQGGFEPFGADYNGAGKVGIFLRFSGQWEDATWSEDGESSGFHYNVHRWYATETGKYTRPDPSGLRGGINLLAYVNSNPIMFVDPDGRRMIVFTGCDIFFLGDDGEIVRSCPAGSGINGSTPSDQNKEDKGPIPEGEWFINPREFSGGWLRDIVRAPGWGRWRVPIHPTDDTETHGRAGFFMHGDDRSDRPDSLGCVDIGDCDTWAQNWAMQEPDKPIQFVVTYISGDLCN